MKITSKLNIKGFIAALLSFSIVACSSDGDDTVADRATDTLQNEERIQMSDRSGSNPDYTDVPDDVADTHAATVHRTIRFREDSVTLDDAARTSLSGVAEAVNDELATQVVVRTVNPNDVTGGELTAVGEERVQAVLEFLQQQGVNVDQVRMDRYSSRELESAQDSAALEEDLVVAPQGLSELRDEDKLKQSDVEQEVVITIVSSAAL